MNQYGKKAYQKVTYSMDPRNSDALMSSRAVEQVIRQVIKQVQQEGEKVLHTQRYTKGGLNNTDYYIPSGFAEQVRVAVMEEIARKSGGRDPGMFISSASNASFKTLSTNILDAGTRAEIAKLVHASGGFFNMGSDGQAMIGVDEGVRVRGSRGRDVSLMSSIASRSISSNRSYQKGIDSLLNAGGYQVSGEGLRTRHGLTEKGMAYSRIARRSRAADHIRQFVKDNPNSREAKALQRAARKATAKKVTGGARFTMSAISVGISAMLAGIGTGVGILNAIKDAVLGIGGEMRRRTDSDRSFNFKKDTTLQWERFAESRGIDKKLLGRAGYEVQSKFSNPLLYKNANFNALAATLGIDTEKLTHMAQSGGDDNMLGILGDVIDSVMKASLEGRSPGKSGLLPGQAYSENKLFLENGLGAGASDMLAAVWNDYRNSNATSLKEWKIGGKQGSFSTWFAQAEKEYGGGNGISGDATKVALEETRLKWAALVTSMNSLKEDALSGILANTGQLVEMIQSFLAKTLSGFFPSYASDIRDKNIKTNQDAGSLVAANIRYEKSSAMSVMKKYGLGTDVGAVVDALRKGDMSVFAGMSPSKFSDLAGDTAAITALVAYMGTQKAQSDIDAASKETFPGGVSYTSATHAARTQRNTDSAMSGAIGIARKLAGASAKKSVSKIGDTPINRLLYEYLDSGDPGKLAELVAYADKTAAKGSNSYGDGVRAQEARRAKALAFAYGDDPRRMDAINEAKAGMSDSEKADFISALSRIGAVGTAGARSLSGRGKVQNDIKTASDMLLLESEANKGGFNKGLGDQLTFLQAGIALGQKRSIEYDVRKGGEGQGELIIYYVAEKDGKQTSKVPVARIDRHGLPNDRVIRLNTDGTIQSLSGAANSQNVQGGN